MDFTLDHLITQHVVVLTLAALHLGLLLGALAENRFGLIHPRMRPDPKRAGAQVETVSSIAAKGLLLLSTAVAAGLVLAALQLPDQPETAHEADRTCGVQQQPASVRLSRKAHQLSAEHQLLPTRVLHPLAQAHEEAAEREEHQRSLQVGLHRAGDGRREGDRAGNSDSDVPTVGFPVSDLHPRLLCARGHVECTAGEEG